MLYAEQGHPCSQCGRRFKTNPEGKKQKTVHMDWHFRVRQRMVDAEKRAQYRSYYVSRTVCTAHSPKITATNSCL